MFERHRFVLALFLGVSVLFGSVSLAEKPALRITVRASEKVLQDVVSSIAFDEIHSSERFTLLLSDALSLLGAELRLQDLFSTEDVVLSKAGQNGVSVGKLEVDILRFEARKAQERFDFIENNISGDHIFVDGGYKRVQTGVRYSYDFEKRRYVQDKDGPYVRALDGTYYLTQTFYTYAPHVNEYYLLSWEVSYSLVSNTLSKSGRKSFQERFYTRLHSYDPYNNRLLKQERPAEGIVWLVASRIASFLSSELSIAHSSVGSVESVKFPRVLIDVGRRDGAREGLNYAVVRDGVVIAELVVRRTSEDYSECEVSYLKFGETVRVLDTVVERPPSFTFPLRLGMTLDQNQIVRFHVGVKQFDIHREEIASFDLSFGFRLEDLLSGVFSNTLFETPLAETSGEVRVRVFRFSDFASLMLSAQLFGKTLHDLGARFGTILRVGLFEGYVYVNVLGEFGAFVVGGGLAW